jgi:hypothetical protein
MALASSSSSPSSCSSSSSSFSFLPTPLTLLLECMHKVRCLYSVQLVLAGLAMREGVSLQQRHDLQ